MDLHLHPRWAKKVLYGRGEINRFLRKKEFRINLFFYIFRNWPNFQFSGISEIWPFGDSGIFFFS
jgi:hypothetical protein